MNRPLKAVAALTRKSPSDKVLQGRGIDQALTDHQDVFPNPNPTPARIREVTQELEDAIEDAATGSKTGRQRLNKAVLAYNAAIRLYQGYVDQIAQGDGVIITQSGLEVSKSAQKAGPLPAPTDPRLGGTHVGELEASVAPLEGARAYVWMLFVGATAPTNDHDWRFATGTTQAQVHFPDLTTGTRVWMRCAAIGTRGLSPWSEPVSRLVL